MKLLQNFTLENCKKVNILQNAVANRGIPVISGIFPKIKRSLCCPCKLMKLSAFASGELDYE